MTRHTGARCARLITRLALGAAVAFAIATCAAPAGATTPGIGIVPGSTQYYPTAWRYYALYDAQTHWNSVPGNGYCASNGWPIYYQDYPMGPPTWPLDISGATYTNLSGSCMSIVNALYADDTQYLMAWDAYCETVVHEIGHDMLGPAYFASVNPADPAHSPDPKNVMYPRYTVTNEPSECVTTHPSGNLGPGV
jgi:hypothetical protein